MKSLQKVTNFSAFFCMFRTIKKWKVTKPKYANCFCDFGPVILSLLLYLKNWDNNVYLYDHNKIKRNIKCCIACSNIWNLLGAQIRWKLSASLYPSSPLEPSGFIGSWEGLILSCTSWDHKMIPFRIFNFRAVEP